ncbi:O-methyltransferase mpaG [Aspergillus affinis]|uniref:O-methyltransferase mpaG n=1 Tax=Aspergillus affinis TaxID=1070780 RepID=UPI0022FE5CCB|nr:O-methyltransferase mpaG [Aspergillus affinis]KAI9042316.1 O-methyltransferase mpaG [Aspergillus affinis]
MTSKSIPSTGHQGEWPNRFGHPAWMGVEVYPVKENLIDGFKQHETEDSVMIVDIEGNYGHDLEEFGRTQPEAPGRLVLEDLPRILEKITDLQDDIKRVPYGFLTPQPSRAPEHTILIRFCTTTRTTNAFRSRADQERHGAVL